MSWISTELIWFLRGDNNIEYLNSKGVDIWNKDAYNWYVKHHQNNGKIVEDTDHGYVKNEDGSFRMMTLKEFSDVGTGSVGQNYSVQWRNFNGNADQIQELVDGMKKDIMSSRLRVAAWNPSELDQTALPPCHSEFQVIGIPLTFEERVLIAHKKGNLIGFEGVEASPKYTEEMSKLLDSYGVPKFGFELSWTQRSVDTFLGLPFNIASYALLAKILEKMTGHVALSVEGSLKCVHFYDNQYVAAESLITRDVFEKGNCQLEISPEIDFSKKNVDEVFSVLEPHHFRLKDYTSFSNIKVEMLAPKEL